MTENRAVVGPYDAVALCARPVIVRVIGKMLVDIGDALEDDVSGLSRGAV